MRSKRVEIDPFSPSTQILVEVREVVKKGGIVSLPTETFYGLATDGLNPQAIRRVYEVKKRNIRRPISLLVRDRDLLSPLVEEIPPMGERLMEAFWPGPLTLILKASPLVPRMVVNPSGGVGLRVSSSPLVSSLLRELDVPLTATSANISGSSPLHDPQKIYSIFKGKVNLFLDAGPLKDGLPSTVLDLTGPEIGLLRKGRIKPEEIEEVLSLRLKRPPFTLLLVCTGNMCRSPMAASFFEGLFSAEDVRVVSAGTGAAKGLPPSENAERVMEEEGLDISGHRSQSLSWGLLQEADLVLVMASEHLDFIRGMGFKGENAYLLKEFAGGQGGDIPDPIGGDLDLYRDVLRMIKWEVERVYLRIKELALW